MNQQVWCCVLYQEQTQDYKGTQQLVLVHACKNKYRISPMWYLVTHSRLHVLNLCYYHEGFQRTHELTKRANNAYYSATQVIGKMERAKRTLRVNATLFIAMCLKSKSKFSTVPQILAIKNYVNDIKYIASKSHKI